MKNKVLFVKKMNEDEFRKYLKRKGKKPAVVVLGFGGGI